MIRLYRLFVAICICESGMNMVAVNMKTNSTGPAQITQVVLDDYNEMRPKEPPMTLAKVRRMDTSFMVFRYYLTRYKRLTHGQSLVTVDEARAIASCWRNGPYGSGHVDYIDRVVNLCLK